MQKIIKSMETKYLQPALELVEDVFTRWDSPEEGRTVRSLVEEIRAKKYYLPALELIMVNEDDLILGYAMFSRFHIEGQSRKGAVGLMQLLPGTAARFGAADPIDPQQSVAAAATYLSYIEKLL